MNKKQWAVYAGAQSSRAGLEIGRILLRLTEYAWQLFYQWVFHRRLVGPRRLPR
jgi:hypothetical protein